MKQRAFTLIELLVVISIISILMGIMLPALGNARARGRQLVCMSNLKNIGWALEIYAGENHDLYPLTSDSVAWVDNPADGTKLGWMETLWRTQSGDKRIYKCLSCPQESGFSYFLSVRAAYVQAGNQVAPVNRATIRFTTAFILAGDSNYNAFETTDCDKDDASQNCQVYTRDGTHWTPHHLGGLNTLYGDTHVSSAMRFVPERMTYRYDRMEGW